MEIIEQRPVGTQETSKVASWLLRYSGGLIKNEKQANYVLIGFVVLAFIISLFFLFGGGSQQGGGALPSGYNEMMQNLGGAASPN